MHIALEIPLAIQGLWAGQKLPFLDMNNTSLIILKLYASLLLGSCVAAVLVHALPEFLPGKRAFAIALFLYHAVAASVLYSCPRFIPYSFGALAEQLKLTPESVWMGCHGVLCMWFVLWWQFTLGYAKAVKQG